MLPKIKKVGLRNTHINDEVYKDNDLFLHASGVEAVDATRRVSKKDFDKLLLYEPEIAILGTGFNEKVTIDSSVMDAAKKSKVELVVMPTDKAAKKFQELVRSGKKVVAKLHITC